MSKVQDKPKINWYRSPVPRDALALLNQRSDWRGLAQALGHLGLLAATGAAAWFAAERGWWLALILALFCHGTCYAFLLNGFHELCHKTVFKSKALNVLFLNIYSFLGGFNPVKFWASHQEHHKYTLHPPDDLEVVLPVKLTLVSFLKNAVVDPWLAYQVWKETIRLSLGRLEGEWEHALFPESAAELRRKLFTWARILLIGHAALIGVSLSFGFWLLPVLVTLAPFYGGWLLFLCNNAQHAGLMDRTPDYRLCCRTILLNPVLRFVYWQMNYHTEHHMYAAVPCYNLGRLHELIKADLPHCPAGLVETWKHLSVVLRRQQAEPGYQYAAELPKSAGV